MINKNITSIEINKITENSKPREQAFFTIIRQSGLKPNTIKQLKIKHLEKIRYPDTPIPCKIDVPNEIEKNKFGRHPSFIAEEAINYIKIYLREREIHGKEKLTPESLLFTIHNKPNKPINIKEISRTFKKTAHKTRKAQPDDLQISILREFFKQKTKKLGHNHANYLMGNTTDNNYKPKNDEFYKELYQIMVMDSLQTEPIKYSALHLRDNQIEKLKKQFEEIQKTIFPKRPTIDTIIDPVTKAKKIEKWLEEHPEDEMPLEEYLEQEEKEQTKLEMLLENDPDYFMAYVNNLIHRLKTIESTVQRKQQESKHG